MENFEQIFDEENTLWNEKSNESYSIWIAEITTAITNCLNGFYSNSIIPIFKLNVPFCEMTLPRTVSLIIHTNSTFAKKICHCINRFFEYHFFNDRYKQTITSNSVTVS